MATRDFDAARAERLRQRDPIRFKLGGETFTCLPVIPVGAGLDLIDAPPTPVGSVGYTKALVSFLHSAVADDADIERLNKVIRSRVDPVGPEDLHDVVAWIAEEYVGRPTSPSTDSSGGRGSTGETSSSGSPAKDSEASSP